MKKDHSAQSKNFGNVSGHKEKKNYLWPAVSGILLVLLLISVFSNYGSTAASKEGLGKSLFSVKMKSFIQNNLLQVPAEVTIENITEQNGLYKFSVLLDGKPAAVSYATKDGAILFPQAWNITEVEKLVSETKAAAPSKEQATEPVKSDTPGIQLFVMSQCPYGVQAENAIKPVLDTLGSKIRFDLRFIANQNADGTFSSLHGAAEVAEDLRQMCAMKYSPNYADYVICRNKNIKSTDWEACATEAKMNVSAIKSCSEGAEGKALLSENIKLGNSIGVGSSPTILINSQSYGGARTPEEFLKAICAAFNNPPAACANTLSANQTQVDEAPHAGCGA